MRTLLDYLLCVHLVLFFVGSCCIQGKHGQPDPSHDITRFEYRSHECSQELLSPQDPGIDRAVLELYTQQLVDGLHSRPFNFDGFTMFGITHDAFNGLTYCENYLPQAHIAQETCYACVESLRLYLMNVLCLGHQGAVGVYKECYMDYSLIDRRKVCPNPHTQNYSVRVSRFFDMLC